MKIKTSRLVIRAPTSRDIPDILEGINDLNVSKWLLVVPYPYKLKDAKDWVKKKKDKESVRFNIELKKEKKIIGGIDIHHIDERQKTATVGYWLNTKYHGQGYGSEALKAILDLAFSKLKLRRLEAEVFEGNEPSSYLLEKFGFQKEGLRRKSCVCKATNKIHNALIYGLLKEEYC